MVGQGKERNEMHSNKGKQGREEEHGGKENNKGTGAGAVIYLPCALRIAKAVTGGTRELYDSPGKAVRGTQQWNNGICHSIGREVKAAREAKRVLAAT